MASQQKQEKIFIFNNRNMVKTNDIFNFSLRNKVTTNPRLRSIWHHSQNQKKYLFLTTVNEYCLMAEQGNNKPQTLIKVYMVKTRKTWKKQEYLFLTTETWQKTRILLNFSWQNKVTTNPRPYSRSIWHHSKNKNKYLFLTTETWKKSRIFLIFHGRTG